MDIATVIAFLTIGDSRWIKDESLVMSLKFVVMRDEGLKPPDEATVYWISTICSIR
jgi:hypothetical protein